MEFLKQIITDISNALKALLTNRKTDRVRVYDQILKQKEQRGEKPALRSMTFQTEKQERSQPTPEKLPETQRTLLRSVSTAALAY